MPRRLHVLLLLAVGTSASCTSFGAVRSAEVLPGPSLTVQGSISTPPGDGPAWFWSFDCAFDCNRVIGGVDAAFAIGQTGRTPFTVGAGVSGLEYPYLEGYVQLGGGANPYGVGARVGLPVTGWTQHQVYARYDVRLKNGQRLLLDPALFYHGGNSPNGANPGHFLALVQGVGVSFEGERVSMVPALSVVAGRGEREGLDQESGPFTSIFAVASVSVSWHRRRAPPSAVIRPAFGRRQACAPAPHPDPCVVRW
jgi:hypothetical protein